MPEKINKIHKMSRKRFLKLGAAGTCSLCAVLPPGKPEAAYLPSSGTAQPAVKGFTDPREGSWFETLAHSAVKCTLCPRQCRLEKDQRSFCRVRENRRGKGYTLAYANPALIQEDPVERKPFFHVLPGTRALSVSTAGCNLHCKFCEVWDMALVDPEDLHAYHMPPEAVVEHARAAKLKSLSFAFGEPVVFYEYMLETARLGLKAGLLNLVHTAGYIRPEPLSELCAHVHAANVDFKSFDQDFYRQVVGGELDPVLDTLRMFRKKGVHLEITNMVIPTLNDDMGMIKEMCSWIAGELGPDVPLHLARFYPLYRLSGLPRTPVSTLDRAREAALGAGLNFVYVARVTGHEGENTFCPDCGKIIIHRVGFIIDRMHMNKNRCGYCAREIPGLWQ